MNWLCIIGLCLGFLGAAWLVRYNVSWKVLGNVVVYDIGEGYMVKTAGPPSPYDNQQVWERDANRFLKWTRYMKRFGFALLALGFLLQLLGVLISSQLPAA